MGTNTGKPYERLTQQVFQTILDDESGVDTIRVEHDVTVQGVKTTHQIDVLWRFRRAGIEHTVLVQCKDKNEAVNKGEMLLFDGVLKDVPGQPRGVFVTRTGYQKGALEVADAAGIGAFTLRPPSEDDWKGRIRGLSTSVRIFEPDFRASHIEIDGDWFLGELEKLGLPPDIPADADMTIDGNAILEDQEGRSLMTANDFLNRLAPGGFVEQEWTSMRHVFAEPTFLKMTRRPQIQRVKLKAWTVEIRVIASEVGKFEVRGDDIVDYILQDVLGGARTTLDKDVRVLRRDPPNGEGT